MEKERRQELNGGVSNKKFGWCRRPEKREQGSRSTSQHCPLQRTGWGWLVLGLGRGDGPGLSGLSSHGSRKFLDLPPMARGLTALRLELDTTKLGSPPQVHYMYA